MTVTFEWRGDFDNSAVNALHAEGFEHPPLPIDWRSQLHRHSLGWVCAWQEITSSASSTWPGTGEFTRSSWIPWWPGEIAGAGSGRS